MYAPWFPTQCQGCLSMVIKWTPTTGLIPCHVQPGPVQETWYPLVGRSHRRCTRLWVFRRFIPQSSMHVNYAPLPPVKDACPSLLSGHLLLDIYHTRFSQDLHMGHGPLQWAAVTVKHKLLGDGHYT